MAYETLLAAAKDLPEDSIYEVISYIGYLKFKDQNSVPSGNQAKKPERRHKKRTLGRMKEIIKMADDFDAIPVGFEEYKS
ncbi:MAG: DUF2281 domain-containing protein [Lachnospiraceae bacterium]|nr:DUF2281 domain-containing protein [Lachnospiraceae bacterium]